MHCRAYHVKRLPALPILRAYDIHIRHIRVNNRIAINVLLIHIAAHTLSTVFYCSPMKNIYGTAPSFVLNVATLINICYYNKIYSQKQAI